MNTSEFKAWFQGFTEGMDSPPNRKQWARIKEVALNISSEPTPYWVYLRDYGYDRWYNGGIRYGQALGSISATLASADAYTSQSVQEIANVPFDAMAAFNHAGRAEFAASSGTVA